MTTPSDSPRPPLEADWIERSFSVIVEGRTITGTARANWGAIEVSITSPIAGLTRKWDGRGWSFAMACHYRPEYRYALAGQFTPRGGQSAEKMLADIYLDWIAVSPEQSEIDTACRTTHRQLQQIARDFQERALPLQEELRGLRQRFKAGELTQQQHQALRKALGKRKDQLFHDQMRAEGSVLGQFAHWMQKRFGRKITLHEAERLLSEVAVIVEEGQG